MIKFLRASCLISIHTHLEQIGASHKTYLKSGKLVISLARSCPMELRRYGLWSNTSAYGLDSEQGYLRFGEISGACVEPRAAGRSVGVPIIQVSAL